MDVCVSALVPCACTVMHVYTLCSFCFSSPSCVHTTTGFGFLTFESEEGVDRVCNEHYIFINGKQVLRVVRLVLRSLLSLFKLGTIYRTSILYWMRSSHSDRKILRCLADFRSCYISLIAKWQLKFNCKFTFKYCALNKLWVKPKMLNLKNFC